MNDKKRLNSYEDLPLVLDVADIQRIMGISRASAYELVHTPSFPAFRRGRLIKVSKIAFYRNATQKPPICVHQIETEEGAGYGKNEQQAAAGMVFLLK